MSFREAVYLVQGYSSVNRLLFSRSVLLTLFDPMDCSILGFPVLHLLELAQIHVHWVSNAIQPPPLSSPSPPAFYLSQHQGLFQWVSFSHHLAKYWSFSFSISLSNEYSGLTSFRIDWFDLLQSRGLGSTYFFFFFLLTAPRRLWNLSSSTRDQTQALGSESAES